MNAPRADEWKEVPVTGADGVSFHGRKQPGLEVADAAPAGISSTLPTDEQQLSGKEEKVDGSNRPLDGEGTALSLPTDPASVPPKPVAKVAPTLTHGQVNEREHVVEWENAGDCSAADETFNGHRFALEETFIIFDWDDTFFPSSWVQDNNVPLDASSELVEERREELLELANLGERTLRLAKQLGTTILVTNAERGWIELSCSRFLPSLQVVLQDMKLLSARTSYERTNFSSPLGWKLKAFNVEIGRNFGVDGRGPAEEEQLDISAEGCSIFQSSGSDTARSHRSASADTPRGVVRVGRKNIISVGDGIHEREALMHSAGNMLNCRTKSLKFLDRPTIQEIIRQHGLLHRCLRLIVHHDGNLDLCLHTLQPTM